MVFHLFEFIITIMIDLVIVIVSELSILSKEH